MSRTAILLIFFAVSSQACADFAPDDFSDPVDECATCDGRADTFGYGDDAYVAAAMLEVANTSSLDVLDHDVALYSNAAANIVEARPFANLEELDAVPYVGRGSFRRISDYAQLNGFVGFCGDGVLQAQAEECDDTSACSVSCETIETLDITFGDVEVEGVLRPGERREYNVPATQGDAVVIHLRRSADSDWQPALEIFQHGKRLEYSRPQDGSDAHIPYRVSQLPYGFELRSTDDYSLVVENTSQVSGPFQLAITCVAGSCAATSEPDLDIDADGVADADDNCVYTPNTDQIDADADAIGDACDLVGGLDRFPGLDGHQLEDALRAENGWVTISGYRAARSFIFSELDNVAGEVSCIYTGFRIATNHIPDHTVMNTEHLWPRSKGAPESDLHHLRPTRSEVNYKRSSFPFGEVLDDQWSDSGASLGLNGAGVVVFEPPHSVKGDIARSLFYVAVQYELDIEPAEEAVLRTWHELDPPDAQERRRHQRIVNFQDSRNLFVDQPDLAGRIVDF